MMNVLLADDPECLADMQTRRTHTATLVFAGHFVYKMKRPMREARRDYSTLARRRFFCFEEVRLNRRLASNVYLGVLPVLQQSDGRLRVGGGGTPVEWAVVMRRLDPSCRLDRRLADGTVTEADAMRLAARLLAFHRAQPRAPLDAETYGVLLRQRLRACAARPGSEASVSGLMDWLSRNRALIAARLAGGHVVEAHGDLRPEHVWMCDGLSITGSLEYAMDLRLLDTADEIGLLALHCERLGAPGFGAALQRAYAQLSGLAPPAELVEFHRALHALEAAGSQGHASAWAHDHPAPV